MVRLPTQAVGPKRYPTVQLPISGSRTETVRDGPTADSGSRERTQRFLDFCFLSVYAIAEIAWLIVLAWAMLSLARWLFS